MAKQRSNAWPEQIEAVYREQGRELWAMFYAQCSDAERASDALQESFTRLHEQNGADIRDIRAWLLQVGRNWLRDVARRQKIAAKPSESLDYFPADAGGPENSLGGRERLQAVREALKQLKTADREVLVLRYSLNWSSIRIAEVLETTSSAVDMRLSRARKRLAELLEKAGIPNER
ncbi:MAG: RNA polymerase sigma factor [Planctomycetaceae bacterium]